MFPAASVAEPEGLSNCPGAEPFMPNFAENIISATTLIVVP